MKNKNSGTSVGMEENLEGLLCYLLGWLTGIIFLIIESKSKFVRFHAWQSIAAFLGLTVLFFLVQFVPFFNSIFSLALNVITIVLWVLLMYKAYQGERYKLPVVGDFAERQSNK